MSAVGGANAKRYIVLPAQYADGDDLSDTGCLQSLGKFGKPPDGLAVDRHDDVAEKALDPVDATNAGALGRRVR